MFTSFSDIILKLRDKSVQVINIIILSDVVPLLDKDHAMLKGLVFAVKPQGHVKERLMLSLCLK